MSRFASLFAGSRGALTAGIVGLAAGGAIGATVAHEAAPRAAMGPVSITRIGALGNIVQPLFGEPVASIRGRVVELFGDRVVIDDGSGRTLVDLGHVPSGLLAVGQTVTVQGRAVTGGLHAQFVVTPDGQVIALRGPGRPHGGDRRHGPRHGPGPQAGSDAEEDADQAPPPSAPVAAAAPSTN